MSGGTIAWDSVGESGSAPYDASGSAAAVQSNLNTTNTNLSATNATVATQGTYINGSGIYTGTLTADQVNVSGINADNITAGTIDADRLNAASIAGLALDIGGTDASSWHVDADGNMWWGNAGSYGAATIKISSAGSVDMTTGTFSGSITGSSGTFGDASLGSGGLTLSGWKAMINFDADKDNIIIGKSSTPPLANLTEEDENKNNIAIGDYALASIYDGKENIAIGSESMRYYGVTNSNSTTNRKMCTALGYKALKGHSANTAIDGDQNTAIGAYALSEYGKGGQVGRFLTCVGAYAGQSVSGEYSIAIGKEAAYSAMTGDYNIAIGTKALYSNTTGANNTVIGTYAGDAITTGASNTV